MADVVATTAPREIMLTVQGMFRAENTEANGSAFPRVSHLAIPVRTAATATYRMVQMTRLERIPIGISLCGLRVSSAAVETASNPIYAKKMMAAAAEMPLKPCGAKGA